MLIPKENEENLFTYQKSWLRVLYNNMSASFEEFGKNALVEHFFVTSLQNSYGRNINDCRAVLKAIPIIHLHGSLGPLPWQVESGKLNRPYHFMYNNDLLDEARQHIKIIRENTMGAMRISNAPIHC